MVDVNEMCAWVSVDACMVTSSRLLRSTSLVCSSLTEFGFECDKGTHEIEEQGEFKQVVFSPINNNLTANRIYFRRAAPEVLVMVWVQLDRAY